MGRNGGSKIARGEVKKSPAEQIQSDLCDIKLLALESQSVLWLLGELAYGDLGYVVHHPNATSEQREHGGWIEGLCRDRLGENIAKILKNTDAGKAPDAPGRAKLIWIK